jgi:rubrerythrin
MKSVYEILQAALTEAKRVHDFYDGLLLHCNEDAVRQLVEKLKDEEAKHTTMIEAMMAQLRLG